ncbi:MAG: hypothetical protein JWM09_151 [Francisellaceae bacterium]|nr:hypothetical protein [Francisellaceae bacterium]
MFNKITSRFIQWLTKEEEYHGLPLCDFEKIRYEIKPGDVLLIEGRSRVSEVIKSITQSSWSHAALYIGRLNDIDDPVQRRIASDNFDGPPDTPLIIEGLMGHGTVISALTSYKKEHIRICRPQGLSHNDAQRVIGYAIARLGSDYNVRQILDLARFLFPWTILPRKYRSSLFVKNIGLSTKTVCSSMIAEAFNSVEFPILPLAKKTANKGIELIRRNPLIYTPRDFDYSPYFKIIKYPFIEFADSAMYHNLPWNRDGLVSNDKFGITEEKQTINIEGITSDYQGHIHLASQTEESHPESIKDKAREKIKEGFTSLKKFKDNHFHHNNSSDDNPPPV